MSVRALPLRILLAAIVGLALGVGPAAPARALSITGLTVAKNGTNTADLFDGAPTPLRIIQSTASVVSSSATAFSTRYAAVVGADVANSATQTVTLNATYRISFSVNANLGEAWALSIATSRVGALTLVNDGSGSATATLNALTMTRSGAGTLAGSLNLAALPSLTGGANADSPFAQTASATISGVGTGAAQAITLDFSWSMSATSTRFGANGDEAAVRMGIDGALPTFTADDYPGPGGRSLSGDGHLVSVTLVPEPGAILLLAAGLVGLVIFGRERA